METLTLAECMNIYGGCYIYKYLTKSLGRAIYICDINMNTIY